MRPPTSGEPRALLVGFTEIFRERELRVSGTVEQSPVIENVRSFIETTFAGRYEIYDILYRGGKHRFALQVFIDSPTGITIHDCEVVSRALGNHLDEVDLIHLPYNLEVSSPGVERRLRRTVDFERSVGKLVRWVLRPVGASSKEVFQARLEEFSPPQMRVSSEKELRELTIDQVEEARLVLEFPRKKKG